MDPNELLAAIREEVRSYRIHGRMSLDGASALVNAAGDLDEWLTNKGFLPADWDIEPGYVPATRSIDVPIVAGYTIYCTQCAMTYTSSEPMTTCPSCDARVVSQIPPSGLTTPTPGGIV